MLKAKGAPNLSKHCSAPALTLPGFVVSSQSFPLTKQHLYLILAGQKQGKSREGKGESAAVTEWAGQVSVAPGGLQQFPTAKPLA